MSMAVTHRRFPNPESVLDTIGIGNMGDIANAKKSLASLLFPLADIWAVYKSIDMVIDLTKQLPLLEGAKKALEKEIVNTQTLLNKAQKEAQSFNAKQEAEAKKIADKIAKLTSELASITSQVNCARDDQDKLNQALAVEYSDRANKMKLKAEREEKAAREKLDSLMASISTATEQLKDLEKKKKAFIDSLL